MSNRKGVLRTFRELAEDQGHVFKPRARWRPIVRLLAKQGGWTFTDAFLWTVYGKGGALMDLIFSQPSWPDQVPAYRFEGEPPTLAEHKP